jgi:hypothetical protein
MRPYAGNHEGFMDPTPMNKKPPKKRERLKIDLPFDEAIKTALKAPPTPTKDEPPPPPTRPERATPEPK